MQNNKVEQKHEHKSPDGRHRRRQVAGIVGLAAGGVICMLASMIILDAAAEHRQSQDMASCVAEMFLAAVGGVCGATVIRDAFARGVAMHRSRDKQR